MKSYENRPSKLREKEVKSKKLPVVMREKSGEKEVIEKMSEEQLFKLLDEKSEGKPFRPMYIPRLLSNRPLFVAWSESKPEKIDKKKHPPDKKKLPKIKEKKKPKPKPKKHEHKKTKKPKKHAKKRGRK